MTLKPHTAKDIEAIEKDFANVLQALREIRLQMLSDGPQVVQLQVGRTLHDMKTIKKWAIKVKSDFEIQREEWLASKGAAVHQKEEREEREAGKKPPRKK